VTLSNIPSNSRTLSSLVSSWNIYAALNPDPTIRISPHTQRLRPVHSRVRASSRRVPVSPVCFTARRLEGSARIVGVLHHTEASILIFALSSWRGDAAARENS